MPEPKKPRNPACENSRVKLVVYPTISDPAIPMPVVTDEEADEIWETIVTCLRLAAQGKTEAN